MQGHGPDRRRRRCWGPASANGRHAASLLTRPGVWVTQHVQHCHSVPARTGCSRRAAPSARAAPAASSARADGSGQREAGIAQGSRVHVPPPPAQHQGSVRAQLQRRHRLVAVQGRGDEQQAPLQVPSHVGDAPLPAPVQRAGAAAAGPSYQQLRVDRRQGAAHKRQERQLALQVREANPSLTSMPAVWPASHEGRGDGKARRLASGGASAANVPTRLQLMPHPAEGGIALQLSQLDLVGPQACREVGWLGQGRSCKRAYDFALQPSPPVMRRQGVPERGIPEKGEMGWGGPCESKAAEQQAKAPSTIEHGCYHS